MGDITRNLSRHEFRCRCGCGLADPHPLVVTGGQEIADRTAAAAIIVRSGGRCAVHNAADGGAPDSQHLPRPERAGYTCAADYVFRGVPLSTVVDAAQLVGAFAAGGIGVYLDNRPGGIDRIHVDVRGSVARWGYVDGCKVSWRFALAELERRKI